MANSSIYEFTTSSAEETEKLGAKVAKALGKKRFVAFYGTLGAGKTAFIRGMATAICPEAAVQSPTYAIINEYMSNGRPAMVHVDAYRINDDDDLYSTGFYDCMEYENCICAVEWSEKIPFAIPDDAVKITIEHIFTDSDEAIYSGEDKLEMPDVSVTGKRKITVEGVELETV